MSKSWQLEEGGSSRVEEGDVISTSLVKELGHWANAGSYNLNINLDGNVGADVACHEFTQDSGQKELAEDFEIRIQTLR